MFADYMYIYIIYETLCTSIHDCIIHLFYFLIYLLRKVDEVDTRMFQI